MEDYLQMVLVCEGGFVCAPYQGNLYGFPLYLVSLTSFPCLWAAIKALFSSWKFLGFDTVAFLLLCGN